MIELRPSEIKELIVACYMAGTPLMIHGVPGIGKSACVYQAAKELSDLLMGTTIWGGKVKDFRVMEKRLAYLAPEDFSGLPNVHGDYTVFKPMEWIATLPEDGHGLIFFDEFLQALLSTQNAASEPILDHRVNGKPLPKGYRFVMASNRKSDKAGVTEMASHMKSRVKHANMIPSLEDFCGHATKHGFDTSVVSFLRFRPQFLCDFKPDDQTYPCPRTWEMVSKSLIAHAKTKLSPMLLKADIAGCVGEAAASDFIAFLEIFKTIPKMEAILADPENTPIPGQLGVKRATASCIATAMNPDNIDTLALYIKRMPKELVAACLEAARKASPTIADHKTFKALEKFQKE